MANNSSWFEGKDPYKILGVARNAIPEDIKKAYRKLAKKVHPDIKRDSAAEERFKELNEAYHILEDEGRRAEYDRGHRVSQERAKPKGDIEKDVVIPETDLGLLWALRAAYIKGHGEWQVKTPEGDMRNFPDSVVYQVKVDSEGVPVVKRRISDWRIKGWVGRPIEVINVEGTLSRVSENTFFGENWLQYPDRFMRQKENGLYVPKIWDQYLNDLRFLANLSRYVEPKGVTWSQFFRDKSLHHYKFSRYVDERTIAWAGGLGTPEPIVAEDFGRMGKRMAEASQRVSEVKPSNPEWRQGPRQGGEGRY